ncbi:MAG: hypothetical protein K9J16_07955 [Melioribacteraceae bacterium]|nr:hypothetical protein [Melioribacteraceae bacterium]MCF8353834.1 hypothetical protein [Melioribacteraceae bacterium]MCF8419186.1 hypothetical protein [Melioribacteraceae bacterium]
MKWLQHNDNIALLVIYKKLNDYYLSPPTASGRLRHPYASLSIFIFINFALTLIGITGYMR